MISIVLCFIVFVFSEFQEICFSDVYKKYIRIDLTKCYASLEIVTIIREKNKDTISPMRIML